MADVWFRFYNSARNSRKVSGLSPICFRCWVLLLTIASEKNGDIPKDFADLAFELRMEPKRVLLAVQTLLDVGLLVDCGSCFRTPDWNERQFKSDSSTARVQAHRERHRNVTVTPPETETETEKKKETKDRRSLSKKAKPRTQIGDFTPQGNLAFEASIYWQERNRIDLASNVAPQIEQFIDHHKSRGSLMADWPAAWRTWYRNAPRMNRQEKTNERKSARSRQLDGAARWFQKEEHRGAPDKTLAALPAPGVVQRDPR